MRNTAIYATSPLPYRSAHAALDHLVVGASLVPTQKRVSQQIKNALRTVAISCCNFLKKQLLGCDYKVMKPYLNGPRKQKNK